MKRPAVELPIGEVLLRPAELARMTGFTLATIHGLMAAGQLPEVRVGRLARVRLSDWPYYLVKRRVQPTINKRRTITTRPRVARS